MIRRLDGGGDGHRFVMLETIREFALERLEQSGETAAARQAHAAYYLALAERADAAYWTRGADRWTALSRFEHDNFRTAWAWFHGQGDTESGLRLASALKPLWEIDGHPSEGRRWLEQGLAAAGSVAPAVQTQSLLVAALLAIARGDYRRGIAMAEDALALADAHDDRFGVARATDLLGLAAQHEGRSDDAIAMFETTIAHYRDLGDRGRLARALCQLATLGNLGAFDRPGDPADLARAIRRCEEGLALFREIGHTVGVGTALSGLASLMFKQRDLVRAETFAREALALHGAQHDIWEIPPSLENLADVAGQRGRPEQAARLYGAAEALRATLDKPIPPFYRDEHARELAVARRALGGPAFAAAVAAGRELPLEQAIAEAQAKPAAVPAPVRDANRALSRRERDVLRLLVDGLSNAEIADRLSISRKTASNHVNHILAKLGVQSRTAAATFAVRHDLV